jgi:hypothetical protein
MNQRQKYEAKGYTDAAASRSFRVSECPYSDGWQRDAWQAGAWRWMEEQRRLSKSARLKTPTEALRTEGPQIEHSVKKSPAQLQREIDEVLGGVSERYAKQAAASTSLKDAIAQARSKVKPGALEDAIAKARVKTEQSHHRQSIWLTREGEFRVRPMSEKVSPLWFFVRDVPSEDELRAKYGR